MRQSFSTVGTPYVPRTVPQTRLDYALLQRGAQYLSVFLLIVAPLTKDPLPFAFGALVPWVVLKIVGRPGMPAAVGYFLVWQWGQAFARTLQAMVDGETLAGGPYGASVERAYWYTLCGVVVMAIAFRLALTRLRPPTRQALTAHLDWRPQDLALLYGVGLLVSAASHFAAHKVGSLDQPLQALAELKVVALFMLFAHVVSTGKGTKILLGVVGFEIVSGFSGLFGDFRAVFIYLLVAAIAARMRWTGTMAVAAAVWFAILTVLGLFWTSVKQDYRELATASSDSQNVKAGLSTRLGYLGGRATSLEDIDWGEAAYGLIIRLAYVDIFGNVISVQEVAPEQDTMRQWQDAIEHVTKPRFLFPDKPVLSDIEVYFRLARGDESEAIRWGTSISVGYMAENFVDLGFPGMLVGVFALGLLLGGICRYVMSTKLPWIMREALALVCIYTTGHNGVEVSLPKFLGAAVMFFLVYALVIRFVFPIVLRWLETRSNLAAAQPS